MSDPSEQPPGTPPSGRKAAYVVGGALLATAANVALFLGLPEQVIAGLLLAPVVTLLVGAFLLLEPRSHSWGIGVLIGGSLALIIGAGTCAGRLGF